MLLFLLACGSGDEALLTTGTYPLRDATGVEAEEGSALPDVSLELDVEAERARFVDGDGAILAEAPIEAWAEAEWPEGCPTNYGSTRMQVATLDAAEIALGDLVVSSPVLVADCPGGDEIVLRGEGEIGGGGGACVGAAGPCLRFAP